MTEAFVPNTGAKVSRVSLSGHCSVMNSYEELANSPGVAKIGKCRLRYEGLRSTERTVRSRQTRPMLSPGGAHLHRCQVRRLRRWTEAKDLKKAGHGH